MIAVDTNILVYSFRADSPQHAAALDCLQGAVSGGLRLAIPWPCVHEFLSVISNPRMPDPAPAEAGLVAIRALLDLPRVGTIGETDRHVDLLGQLLQSSKARGPKIHDARIAAICLGHGVDELWTADRDFGSFPMLRTRNPMVGT